MKIIKTYKKIDFTKSFVVKGTPKELLEFEKVLQYNGIKSRSSWNDEYRHDCNRIFVNFSKNRYEYHSHNCNHKELNVNDFL